MGGGLLRKHIASLAAIQAWYNAADELSCVAHMDPGDVLIFREDTLHRTQDQEVDRVAFIWDILRFPLPDTPMKGDEDSNAFHSAYGRRRLAEREARSMERSSLGKLMDAMGVGRRGREKDMEGAG